MKIAQFTNKPSLHLPMTVEHPQFTFFFPITDLGPVCCSCTRRPRHSRGTRPWCLVRPGVSRSETPVWRGLGNSRTLPKRIDRFEYGLNMLNVWLWYPGNKTQVTVWKKTYHRFSRIYFSHVYSQLRFIEIHSSAGSALTMYSKELIVSMDAVILWRPWWIKSSWMPITEGVHGWDVLT